MKSLHTMYEEIRNSDELKKAFVAAVKNNTVEDFLKAQGCETSAGELQEFLAEKAEEIKPLSLEDMRTVAGGIKYTEQTYECSFDGCTDDCSHTCIRDCC